MSFYATIAALSNQTNKMKCVIIHDNLIYVFSIVVFKEVGINISFVEIIEFRFPMSENLTTSFPCVSHIRIFYHKYRKKIFKILLYFGL